MNEAFATYYSLLRSGTDEELEELCECYGGLLDALTDRGVQECIMDIEDCCSHEEAAACLDKVHQHVAYTFLTKHGLIELRHLYDTDEECVSNIEALKARFVLEEHTDQECVSKIEALKAKFGEHTDEEFV